VYKDAHPNGIDERNVMSALYNNELVSVHYLDRKENTDVFRITRWVEPAKPGQQERLHIKSEITKFVTDVYADGQAQVIPDPSKVVAMEHVYERV
jgi:hypothetical protein